MDVTCPQLNDDALSTAWRSRMDAMKIWMDECIMAMLAVRGGRGKALGVTEIQLGRRVWLKWQSLLQRLENGGKSFTRRNQ